MEKCKSSQKPDLYVEFRRKLIENPVLNFFDYNAFRNKIIPLKEDLAKAYKEVDDNYFINGELYQCDRLLFFAEFNNYR